MSRLDSHLEAALERITRAGQRRTLRATTMLPGGRIERAGRTMLDFSSNDYLGLARHPLLVERSAEWAARDGSGSGSSRLVTGTSAAHLALEARIAEFKHCEAALIFASGWQANAAAIPALLAAIPGVAIFTDRLIHASMHAGIAMAGVRQHRFRHNDLGHLETLLAEKGADAPARLILTESVFSMDGDRADMVRLADIAERHDAALFVDEAHATGVLGPEGRGLSALVPGKVDLVMGTFSKALGGFGAYVAGSRVLIDYLTNAASGFIFTTAPPPAVLGAVDAALDLLPGMDAERVHLAALGDRLRAGLARLGLDHGASSTQIVPAVIGPENEAMALSARLEAAGFLASAIRPPTVPAGTSRLRLALRAGHSEADIDALLAAIEAITGERGVKLLFAHGWSFDRHFWEPLAALLPEWAHEIDDRGYFGAPHEPAVEDACLAITHSFGTMRVLAAPPPGLMGIVAINGFERFTAVPGRPGVPVRVLDRMLRRFETDPRGVLAEFRKTCGSTEAFGEIDPEALASDLLRLRDAAPSLPDVPILAIHGTADPLLRPEMRAATFTGAQVRRIDHEAGGHLLPLKAPELCAAAIRGMLA